MSLESAIERLAASVSDLAAALAASRPAFDEKSPAGPAPTERLATSAGDGPAEEAKLKAKQAKKSEPARPAEAELPPDAPAAETANAGTSTDAAPAAAETPTSAAFEEPYENVKDTLTNLIKEKGRDVAVALLGRFGVKTAKELPPDRYVEFLEACFDEWDKK